MSFVTNLLGRKVKFQTKKYVSGREFYDRTGEIVMVSVTDIHAVSTEYVVLTDRINFPGKELVVLKQKDLTFEEEYEFNGFKNKGIRNPKEI